MRKKKHKNIRDSYLKYQEITEEGTVNVKDFTDINKLYNKFLIRKALAGEVVTIPARMGTLSIQGKKIEITLDENGKIKNLAPNWAATKRLWDSNPKAKEEKKLIYCTNENTDGIRYKWLWSKFNMLVENKALYTLILTRENKRLAHKSIVEGKINYIVKN